MKAPFVTLVAALNKFDANVFGIGIPEGAPVSTQERAYSSPIWYAPGTRRNKR